MGRANQAMGGLAIVAMLAVALMQRPTVVDAQQDGLTVVAQALTTPGGFTWNANDVLFVALSGSGGGDTGAAAVIDDGCPSALATGIASIRTAQDRVYGAEAIAELDGQLYLLISNGGGETSSFDLSNGVYRVAGDGSLDLITDHAAFLEANGFTAPGNPVTMVSGDGALWIADQLNGLITRVVPGGDETQVADLSGQGFQPADLALGADGSLYVAGSSSSDPGSGSVVNVAADGTAQTVWSGLTMASGVAIGNDGALYATELASGASDTAPNGAPGSGRLVSQSGDAFEVVADGLDYPAGLGTGPDGAVYFATGAVGSVAGTGTIVRYASDGSAAEAAPANCEPIAETLGGSTDSAVPTQDAAATETPEATEPAETPTPENTPTLVPTPSPTAPWTPDSAAPTGEVVDVGLSEYTIDMPTQLPAGPVTFNITNYGSLTHSFAIEGPGIDEQLTHELEPGQTGAFTVDLKPGTYSVTSPSTGDRDNGMSLVLTVS